MLRKLSNNPHYKLSPKQKQSLEVTTQEVRNNDVLVTAPKVRRKRSVNTREVRRDSVSKDDLRAEVQETITLPESDS